MGGLLFATGEYGGDFHNFEVAVEVVFHELAHATIREFVVDGERLVEEVVEVLLQEVRDEFVGGGESELVFEGKERADDVEGVEVGEHVGWYPD